MVIVNVLLVISSSIAQKLFFLQEEIMLWKVRVQDNPNPNPSESGESILYLTAQIMYKLILEEHK